MKNTVAAPIALFDSGAGGIGVLREVQKLLPNEQLLYFGDSRNAPYGERPAAEVRDLVLRHCEHLLCSAKALVLACNTATAVAAAELRRRHPDTPIIGIEPALCPAAAMGDHPKILVLATKATLEQKKYALLRKKYEKRATVWSVPAPGLVRLVEAGLGDSPQADAYLQGLLSTLPGTPDVAVLGCTHFPFAAASLRRVLGNIPLQDGASGTARELCRQLRLRDLAAPKEAQGGIILTSSAPRALPLLAHLLQA